MKQQRGAALLIVLWALALLTGLMASVITVTGLENHQSTYELNRTRALDDAQAGLALAIAGLLTPVPGRWVADGQPHSLRFDEALLTVDALSEQGKLDLNAASLETFAALLRNRGASTDKARLLIAQLQARRATNHPLLSLEELQDFATMDPTLYARLLPDVTLWSGRPLPDARYASIQLRTALALAPPTFVNAINDAGPIISVHSKARLENGFTAQLDITLRLTASAGSAPLYQVLRWKE